MRLSLFENLLTITSAASQSFTEWRNLNLNILNSYTPSREDSRLYSSIICHISRLNTVLQPFIEPVDAQIRSQQENLSSILLEGVKFGVLLLSQPTKWVFGWGKSRQKANNKRMVVFPSLGETGEKSGKVSVRIVTHAIEEEI